MGDFINEFSDNNDPENTAGVQGSRDQSLKNLLDQLEERINKKILKLIYELEDQLNITLPKN